MKAAQPRRTAPPASSHPRRVCTSGTIPTIRHSVALAYCNERGDDRGSTAPGAGVRAAPPATRPEHRSARTGVGRFPLGRVCGPYNRAWPIQLLPPPHIGTWHDHYQFPSWHSPSSSAGPFSPPRSLPDQEIRDVGAGPFTQFTDRRGPPRRGDRPPNLGRRLPEAPHLVPTGPFRAAARSSGGEPTRPVAPDRVPATETARRHRRASRAGARPGSRLRLAAALSRGRRQPSSRSRGRPPSLRGAGSAVREALTSAARGVTLSLLLSSMRQVSYIHQVSN